MTALHHEVHGADTGRTLLLGGSLGTTLRMWDQQLPLAERIRIVPFDHRGHGGSPVPPAPYEIEDLGRDVLELIDALGLERASFCGLSIGGMVGMWLGANAPDRIERLVLICTSAHMPPASAWQERTAVVREAGSVEPLADTVVERWLTPQYAAAHPAVRDQLRRMLADSPPDGYIACCGAIERMDLRDALGTIRAPTLVISGSEDLSTPPEHQEAIVAAIPKARHVVVGPAAHLATIEQPDDVNQLILEHLT
jgi:3-oxoadipate enol-lactonase